MSSTRHGERFFFFYALGLFLVVITGFPLHALVNAEKLPPMRPHLHLHAVSMGSWFALLVLQTRLVAAGNFALHKTLGALSIIIVASMLPTGVWISWENMQRTGDDTIFTVNSINALVFVIFYALALVRRNRPDHHKRFMLFASLALMFPAFARIVYVLDLNDYAVLPMWLVFLLAIPAYDLFTQRRLTGATLIALGVNIAYIGVLLSIGPPPQ